MRINATTLVAAAKINTRPGKKSIDA